MNDNVPPVFILDANIFIEAYKRYYGLDLCPGFWECLIHYFHSKRLKSIDHVRSELVGYGDELSDWVGNAPGELFVSSLESQVTEAYREVMSWVYRNQQFSDAAKNEFSRGADGWLAAHAKAYGGVVVTLEVLRPDVKRRVPLPNVCDQFGIVYIDTFAMLSRLEVRFDWHCPP